MRAKEIRELVKIVEQSTIGEIEVTRWLVHKIRISKSTSPHVQISHASGSGVHASAEAAPVRTIVEAPVSKTSDSSKTVEIKAPMVGTFYRAPSPDSAPYVKEGDVIAPGKVLCIIEAMKLMNEIEAEISGRIVKILINNSQPVEFNQPLFIVEQD